MKHLTSMLMVAVTAALLSTMAPRPVSAAPVGAAPVAADRVAADRVVVMYFHRTQRCPTCMKMGAFAEEATKTAFAEQLKKGDVQFFLIDFQDKKNAALTKGYRITGPTLIVAKIVNNKVAEFTNLEEIWMKVRDKNSFLKYVQTQTTTYLQQLRKKSDTK